MKSFQELKQVALNVLRETSKVAEDRGVTELVDDLRREEEHLRLGELNVVICGECKRGKSSLLNAFLEEPDLCPVDAPVATNSITMIRYGQPEQIVVHLRSADAGAEMQPTIEKITRAQLRDYVTEQGNEGNRRRVQLAEVTLPSAKLRDGLVLIDTPGVGTLNVEHTAATYGIIPYADAVLFIGAASEPLTEPELAFCKRIARHTPHLLHVLTKRDAVDNPSEILRDNLRKLSFVLDRPEEALPGVTVSSSLKLAFLQDGDAETLELSGFADLERNVWQLLERRATILLARACAHVLMAISHLRLPISTERDGLAARSEAEIKAIDEQLQGKLLRAEDLVSESPIWVDDLHRRMNLLQTQAAKWLADEFRVIEASLDRYLELDVYLDNTAQLGAILTADCNGSFAIVLEHVQEDLVAIAAAVRMQTSLDLAGGTATAGAPAAIALPAGIEHQRTSGIHKASRIGWAASTHSIGLGVTGAAFGGAIGAIIGTFLAPGIGTYGGAIVGANIVGAIASLVGGIFGFKRGWTETREQDRESLRATLRTECRKRLTQAHADTAQQLMQLLTNATSDIHQGLLRAIRLDQKTCKIAVETLQSARKERHADSSKRLLELDGALKKLGRLEELAAELIDVQPAAEH